MSGAHRSTGHAGAGYAGCRFPVSCPVLRARGGHVEAVTRERRLAVSLCANSGGALTVLRDRASLHGMKTFILGHLCQLNWPESIHGLLHSYRVYKTGTGSLHQRRKVIVESLEALERQGLVTYDGEGTKENPRGWYVTDLTLRIMGGEEHEHSALVREALEAKPTVSESRVHWRHDMDPTIQRPLKGEAPGLVRVVLGNKRHYELDGNRIEHTEHDGYDQIQAMRIPHTYRRAAPTDAELLSALPGTIKDVAKRLQRRRVDVAKALATSKAVTWHTTETGATLWTPMGPCPGIGLVA